jgi:DNA-binding HxlR family transcriptional regulator
MNDVCQPFASDCAIRLATDLLAHTWDPVVLAALRTGPRRRSDLLAYVGGISDKVLSETLRRLMFNGLLKRTAGDADRAVTYELTELGESLVTGPMAALGSWAVARGDQVLAAQQVNS